MIETMRETLVKIRERTPLNMRECNNAKALARDGFVVIDDNHDFGAYLTTDGERLVAPPVDVTTALCTHCGMSADDSAGGACDALAGPDHHYVSHRELARALDETRRELAAYKRAKQENDDRFMGERDEARAEVERLRTELADERRIRQEALADISKRERAIAGKPLNVPLDVDRLARAYWDALVAAEINEGDYGNASAMSQGMYRIGASAIVQAIASALLSEQAVEAAGMKVLHVDPDDANDGNYRGTARKAIEAALRVAVAVPREKVATKPANADDSFPEDIEYLHRWERGLYGGDADPAASRRVLAWLVRRELARTGESK